MSSLIEGIDETIAKTMADIGWPGAELVQPDSENEAEEIQEPSDDEPSDTGAEEILDDAEGELEEDPQEEAPQESTETENKYRPKWKKAALAEFDKLSPEAKRVFIEEDQRRENDFHSGIEQYKQGHLSNKEWDDVVSPYRATIDQFQVKPQEAVRSLLATDHILRYGQPHQKIGTLLQAIQNYGINPADIVTVIQHAQNSNGQQEYSPEYAALNQRLQNFEQQQYAQQRQAEEERQAMARQQDNALRDQIQSFAADPDHEHFEILKPTMAGLLQSGGAKDLDEAYDMALKIHPSTAKIWIAKQQKEWAEARKSATEKAKKVTNVRSNGRASVSKPNRTETMDETIARVAQDLGLT